MSVSQEQRYTRYRPCPICGGQQNDPRGVGKRCIGYLSDDGLFARCSRNAGPVPKGPDDLWPHPLTSNKNEAPNFTTYDYRDENGKLLFQVVRKPNKIFLQRQPNQEPHGFCSKCNKDHDDWIWRTSAPHPVRMVLYRLPELLAALATASIIFICEGEKDVNTAWSAGLVATCNPRGAGKWHSVEKQARDLLSGSRVIVIQDNDDPGIKHARQVAASLPNAFVLTPPAQHKDFTDWIYAGATAEDVLAATEDVTKVSLRVVPSTSNGAASQSVPPSSNGLRQDKGQNAAIAANVARLLRTHEDWSGGPRLDRFGYIVQWPVPLPNPLKEIDRMHGHLSDVDASEIQDWCIEHQVRIKLEGVREGVALAASKNSYDSLTSYVESLPIHDGQPRLDTWLSNYFGAQDNIVTRRIGRAWLMSALARAIKPGCVADGMLILEGDEGSGKNWGIEELFGHDRVGQLGVYQIGKHKEADRMAGMFWILHDDELRSLKKQSKGTIFSWLTRKSDTYRLEWAREIRTYARRAILVGSKNPPYDYLDDDENRRYWPVRTGKIDVAAIQRDRDQLLSEAHVAVKKNESWIIGKDDPIWSGLSEARRGRAADDPMVMDVVLILPADADVVTTRYILNALSVSPDKRKSNEQAVAACLKNLGFERERLPRPVLGNPWAHLGRPWVYVRSGVVLGPETKIYL